VFPINADCEHFWAADGSPVALAQHLGQETGGLSGGLKAVL